MQPEADEGLPQPSGGRKGYRGEGGKVVQVSEWFGYKLHLPVDVRHEVALAYHVSDPKRGDNEGVEALVEQAEANLGERRVETLAYDKAADDIKVHEVLHEHGLKPVIEARALWKEEKEEPLRIGLPAVYDEAGTAFCYDTASDPPTEREMAGLGHDKGRDTVKYRRPAMHDGLPCASMEKCNAGKAYGLTVRVECDDDLRRFPAIGRAAKQFGRLYKGRTAVERVNGRLKVFWGVDDGHVAGARRFHAHVGVVMVVHVALARWLARQPRREGGPWGQMSLRPIAEALARGDDAHDPAAAPEHAPTGADR